MPMRVLVAIDKPSYLEPVSLAIRSLDPWPGAEIVAVPTIISGFFRFAYPRSAMAASCFPRVAEPAYRYGSRFGWAGNGLWNAWSADPGSRVFRPDERLSRELGDQTTGRAALARLVHDSEVVVNMTDRYHRGTMAFRDMVTSAGAVPEEALRPGLLDCQISSLRHDDLVSTMSSIAAGQAAPWRPGSAMEREANCRDFLDYNWVLNCRALLLPVLARSGCVRLGDGGGGSPEALLSKFSMQAFLHLARRAEPPTRFEFLREMSRWRGTGRYTGPTRGFASETSRSAIEENLRVLGLARSASDGAEGLGARIHVTEAGRRFADMLPKSALDPDLPFRLQAWCGDWPASRPAVEAYVRRYFGNLKRTAGMSQMASGTDIAGAVASMRASGMDAAGISAAAQVSAAVVEAAVAGGKITAAQERAIVLASRRAGRALA